MMIIDFVENQSILEYFNKIRQFQNIIREHLKKDYDYGILPGTNKSTLYKPGAEKIAQMLLLVPDYQIIDKIEDYDNAFFAYNIKCTFYRGNMAMGQGLGHCNSKESKYRYKNVQEAEIPSNLDKNTLQKKSQYGKTTYRIESDDACTIANTILKMSKKRAFIDAILQLAALSDIFETEDDHFNATMTKEKLENMTFKEASDVKFKNGKHKGRSVQEVWTSDVNYITWFKKEGTDEVLLKAISVIDLEIERKKAAAAAKKSEPEQTETKEVEEIDRD